MTSTQSKKQKLALSADQSPDVRSSDLIVSDPADSKTVTRRQLRDSTTSNTSQASSVPSSNANNFGVDVDDLTDDTDSDGIDDDDDLDYDGGNASGSLNGDKIPSNHADIQEQLAAAGPAGVAAAAAIASARRRKRAHSFETNPSVRKRQQTRLIRKLRACIDEYTMRVGQQAVVLITMPGKTAHNFKVFGAQPLESVIRSCKNDIMGELDQALLEQAPQQFKDDSNKHELPPLVIDGIPTPVEKMTQAQLRAFIPLMLKYSTGRGKPGWGKDSTRPPWWPETLPWANVRSDARDENEKQRISWTTTLRQIVTNCYKYHGRDDLLPKFDESAEAEAAAAAAAAAASGKDSTPSSVAADQRRLSDFNSGRQPLGSSSRSSRLAGKSAGVSLTSQQNEQQAIYASPYATNFVHTIANGDGTVSLVQVDPANAQILTLPDGTQVRAVRLQTLGSDSLCGQQVSELQEITGAELASTLEAQRQQEATGQQQQDSSQALQLTEATLGPDGQIIVTGEDGTQSCYPMSSLVSIPASMYQQLAQSGQQLQIVTADGTALPANAVSIAIQDQGELQQHHQQVEGHHQQQSQATSNSSSSDRSSNNNNNNNQQQQQQQSEKSTATTRGSEPKKEPKTSISSGGANSSESASSGNQWNGT